MQGEISHDDRVVVDSNFIVRLLTLRPDTPYGILWREWEERGTVVFAPALLPYEVTNAMWRFENRGELSPGAATFSIKQMNDLQIEVVGTGEIHLRALEFVRRFSESKAYDSHFLALADILQCELWTADKKLFNRVGQHLSWVQLVDE